MISLPQGFRVGAPEAVDSRLALSFEEMRTMIDNLMPTVYFTVCKDDSKIYVYNKGNEVLADTGKFRLYAAGSGEGGSGDASAPIEIEKIKTLFEREEQ